MPAWSVDDVHRSVRDWLTLALGSPPWSVWTERRDMDPTDRPVAVVEQASEARPTRYRTSVPQGNVEWVQTYTVACYPEAASTPQESALGARQVAETLRRCAAHGLVVPADPDAEPPTAEQSLAPPMHIPLMDYEGVPVVGAGRAADGDPYDWLLIEDVGGLRPLQDASDQLLFTVPFDIRLSWEAPGREPPPAPIATGMPGWWAQP